MAKSARVDLSTKSDNSSNMALYDTTKKKTGGYILQSLTEETERERQYLSCHPATHNSLYKQGWKLHTSSKMERTYLPCHTPLVTYLKEAERDNTCLVTPPPSPTSTPLLVPYLKERLGVHGEAVCAGLRQEFGGGGIVRGQKRLEGNVVKVLDARVGGALILETTNMYMYTGACLSRTNLRVAK
jgi:hypothetical protein